MAHTPGPWDLDDDTMEVFSSAIGQESGWIASVIGNDGNGRPLPQEEIASNARLIAAAPEMLSVLRTALNELVCLYEEVYPDDESDNDTTAAIDAITDVIAKAERSA